MKNEKGKCVLFQSISSNHNSFNKAVPLPALVLLDHAPPTSAPPPSQ